jgi:tRNA(His) 5'-end guanylyltransferase
MRLADRMRYLEQMEAGRRLMPRLPILARLDGKCFTRLTQGLARPYDPAFMSDMITCARDLGDEFQARAVHTQSDEITLAFWSDDPRSELPFGGKLHKMISVLASTLTVLFNEGRRDAGHASGTFDCRVWQVPTLEEATNVFLWRERDATRNSVQAAARSVYSHKQCKHKNGGQLQEMLHAKGINWNDYPDGFKRGTYLRRVKIARTLTAAEMAKIPERHRPEPDVLVERTCYELGSPCTISRIANRVDWLFRGAEPERVADTLAPRA